MLIKYDKQVTSLLDFIEYVGDNFLAEQVMENMKSLKPENIEYSPYEMVELIKRQLHEALIYFMAERIDNDNNKNSQSINQ